MPISLIIQPPSEGGVSSYSFESEQDVVTIGRGADNDLAIQDPHRVLSTHHARMEFRGNQYWITDLGSTNGSTLNGHPLAANEPEVVVAGDRIGLASYVVTLATGEEEVAPPKADFGTRIFVPGEEEVTTPLEVGPNPAVILRRRVRRVATALEGAAQLPEAGRGDLLDRMLREQLDRVPDGDLPEVIASLRDRFPDREHDRRVEERGEVVQKEEEPQVVEVAGKVQDLHTLLASLLESSDLPRNPAVEAELAGRIDIVLRTLLDGFSALLQGRREFEVAYDASATRFHGLGANRVKLRATGQEPGSVAAYLFDVEACPTDAEAEGALREATEDCLRHQIGLLHGLKRCVREVLREIEPKRLEKEAAGESVKLGPLSLSRGNLPGARQSAWRHFVETYERIAEMDEATFNNLLRPVLARGWLEMQDRGDDDAG